MRLLRALRDFFGDLVQGDLVALAIAGLVLLLMAVVAGIWIADLRKRSRETKGKKPPSKSNHRSSA